MGLLLRSQAKANGGTGQATTCPSEAPPANAAQAEEGKENKAADAYLSETAAGIDATLLPATRRRPLQHTSTTARLQCDLKNALTNV